MPHRPLRICYALNTFDLGGAETVALDLARSHDPARFEVEVVAFIEPKRDREPEMRRRFREAGVRTHAIEQGSYRSPLALWRIYRYLRRGRFDIVHGHNRGSDYWGVRMGVLAGVPHRSWTRHLVYNDMSDKQLRRYRWAAQRSHVVIAVSDTVHEACRLTEGIPADRIETVVNGIDMERFAALSSDRCGQIRSGLGLGPDETFLLFVGRFSEQKAPEAFIEVVAGLRSQGRRVRGFMCGYGPLAERLAGLVAADTGVEILGLRSDIPDLLGSCDLFVSTSRNEGLPLNLMEAMAGEAAFVAPGIPQVRELVAGDPELERQLFTPPPPAGPVPDDLLREWTRLAAATLDDGKRRRRIGRSGRGMIGERFSLDRMVQRYENAFLAACSTTRKDQDQP